MELLLTALLSGVGLGCLYGLLGFAIVLLLKSTGVANFATGSLATLSSFGVFTLMREFSLPISVAILIALLGAALCGVLVYLIVMLPKAPPGPHAVNSTIRTLGLSLVLLASMQAAWGSGAPYAFPPLVHGSSISIGSLVISAQTLIAVALALLAAGGLWAFFRFTQTGLSFRAVAEDPETARLLGLKTVRLGAIVWAMSTALALLAGVLIAPTAFLSPTMMEPYLLYAFTGVVLGGLTSLPGALLGGVVVGIISNVTTVLFSPELALTAVFGILVGTLVLRPDGLLGQPAAVRL